MNNMKIKLKIVLFDSAEVADTIDESGYSNIDSKISTKDIFSIIFDLLRY